jgi:hypothetical protein
LRAEFQDKIRPQIDSYSAYLLIGVAEKAAPLPLVGNGTTEERAEKLAKGPSGAKAELMHGHLAALEALRHPKSQFC